MRFFIILTLLWAQLGHASGENCEDALKAHSLAALIGGITRTDLDKTVEVEFRSFTSDQALADFATLKSVLKQSGYLVELEMVGSKPSADGLQLTYRIKGSGREVAQAILEIGNPQIGGSLATGQSQWLTKRSYYSSDYKHNLVTGEELKKQLLTPIRDLKLSGRAGNPLPFSFVGELVQQKPEDLMSIHRFGRSALVEVEAALAARGLRLGMQVDLPAFDDLARGLAAEKPSINYSVWQTLSPEKMDEIFDRSFVGLSMEQPVLVLKENHRGRFILLDLEFVAKGSIPSIAKYLNRSVGWNRNFGALGSGGWDFHEIARKIRAGLRTYEVVTTSELNSRMEGLETPVVIRSSSGGYPNRVLVIPTFKH